MTKHLPFNISPLPVRLRSEDYLLLDRAGAFADYAKTELIEGEIVYMNAQHRPHASAKMKLYDALRDALQELKLALVPLTEASVCIPPESVPEPDIVLTSEPDGEGPIPVSSVALVVEVAHATLDVDMGRKLILYATANVPEYWVANVEERIVHQMWLPDGNGYGERRDIPFGQDISSEATPSLRIVTATL